MKDKIIAEMDSYIEAWSQWIGPDYQIYTERKDAMEIAKRIVLKHFKEAENK